MLAEESTTWLDDFHLFKMPTIYEEDHGTLADSTDEETEALSSLVGTVGWSQSRLVMPSLGAALLSPSPGCLLWDQLFPGPCSQS